jgi:hypothetical protein
MKKLLYRSFRVNAGLTKIWGELAGTICSSYLVSHSEAQRQNFSIPYKLLILNKILVLLASPSVANLNAVLGGRNGDPTVFSVRTD